MKIPESVFLKIQKMRSNYKPFGEKNIVFLHPPKCGGTSITQELKLKSIFSYYDMNNAATMRTSLTLQENGRDLSHQTIRKIMILDALEREKAFICGHFDFDMALFSKYFTSYDFITLIRHPVDKFISQFFFNNIKQDFTDFLETEQAQSWANDYTTRFAGHGEVDFELALKNLKQFRIVGKLEELSSFEEKFYHHYKKKIRIPKFNVGRKKRLIDEDDIRKVKKLCAQDIALYKEF